MTNNSPAVEYVSDCFIKPHHLPDESEQPLHLSPWDLMNLSVHYIQKGLLFAKPHQPTAEKGVSFVETPLERLKTSLSLALSHFYPLAGRLKTLQRQDPPSRVVYVDCRDSPGAKFIHATLDMTVSDILSQTYVPRVVQSLFDHHKAVNHDGHVLSLFSVQVTELADGVFIGCSMNHCLGDGTSYWNFLKSWSEIFRAGSASSASIPRAPILKRWFPDGHGPTVSLPYSRPDEFISRFEAPELRERIFHFSAESVAKLKAKANAESKTAAAGEISSLQSLSAAVWRCVTRARDPPPGQPTCCRLSVDARSRLDPPVPESYFGNVAYRLIAHASAGDLLGRDLGWAARKLHRAVAECDDEAARGFVGAWLQSPKVPGVGQFASPYGLVMASSPRFDKYGSEFGMGKAVAVRSGYALKFDGKVFSYPGRDGGGSIDLEVCLLPETMRALESDPEFIEAAALIAP